MAFALQAETQLTAAEIEKNTQVFKCLLEYIESSSGKIILRVLNKTNQEIELGMRQLDCPSLSRPEIPELGDAPPVIFVVLTPDGIKERRYALGVDGWDMTSEKSIREVADVSAMPHFFSTRFEAETSIGDSFECLKYWLEFQVLNLVLAVSWKQQLQHMLASFLSGFVPA